MLIGKTLLEVIQRDSSNQQNCSNTNFNCNLLLGGQIAGETHRLFHIYPEGNFIEATRDTPYFQIGESKYGKPIIDRVLTIDTPLEQAMCCALISIDSTLRSNLSVGLPLDTLLYRSGSLSSAGQHRITDSDPYFNRIRKAWSEGLLHTFQTLPTWTPAEREEVALEYDLARSRPHG
jgi:putative proteasome-type protease